MTGQSWQSCEDWGVKQQSWTYDGALALMQDSGRDVKMQWILSDSFPAKTSSVQPLEAMQAMPMRTEGKAAEFELNLNVNNVRLPSLRGDVAQSAQQLHSRHVLVFIGWTRPQWPLWFRVPPHGFLPWCQLGLCLCELCESWMIRWKYAFSLCSKAFTSHNSSSKLASCKRVLVNLRSVTAVELAWKTFDGFDRWALPTAKVG